MNKEKSSAGRIQWGRMLKKLSPYTHTKGIPLSEALRTKGVLDKASRKI